MSQPEHVVRRAPLDGGSWRAHRVCVYYWLYGAARRGVQGTGYIVWRHLATMGIGPPGRSPPGSTIGVLLPVRPASRGAGKALPGMDNLRHVKQLTSHFQVSDRNNKHFLYKY